MAFLTGQSWCVLASWYTVGGPEQGFWRCFAHRLNQSLVLFAVQAIKNKDQDKQANQYSCAFPESAEERETVSP